MSAPRKRPMIAKRGVSESTIKRVATQITEAEQTQAQESTQKRVPLSQIKLWEQQPRNFRLTMDDVIRGGVLDKDKDRVVKAEELERIISLAYSIKVFGILNTPLAYALPGTAVQLVGGQRRTMGYIFALYHLVPRADEENEYDLVINPDPDLSLLDTHKIELKVYERKPDTLTLEKIAMVDNTCREDLPIQDKLSWALRFANLKEKLGDPVVWIDFIDTLNVSRAWAYKWVKILSERTDPWVDKAIKRLLAGKGSLKKLYELAAAESNDREELYHSLFENRLPVDNAPPKVALGSTQNISALKSLVLANVEESVKDRFSSVDWGNSKSVKKAFADFLDYWGEKHG